MFAHDVDLKYNLHHYNTHKENSTYEKTCRLIVNKPVVGTNGVIASSKVAAVSAETIVCWSSRADLTIVVKQALCDRFS
jgi:hypothetical protein